MQVRYVVQETNTSLMSVRGQASNVSILKTAAGRSDNLKYLRHWFSQDEQAENDPNELSYNPVSERPS